MKIEDNFVNQKDFDKLQTFIMGREFSWFFNPFIVFNDRKEKEFQFIHIFYFGGTSNSPHSKDLTPIIEIIAPIAFYRIKANLQPKTLNNIENAFHVDIAELSTEKLKQWTTSIFYINTNNGYTEFEDGTKVESVANRMLTFPANLKHRGASCTDEKRRMVINFNYFQK